MFTIFEKYPLKSIPPIFFSSFCDVERGGRLKEKEI